MEKGGTFLCKSIFTIKEKVLCCLSDCLFHGRNGCVEIKKNGRWSRSARQTDRKVLFIRVPLVRTEVVDVLS